MQTSKSACRFGHANHGLRRPTAKHRGIRRLVAAVRFVLQTRHPPGLSRWKPGLSRQDLHTPVAGQKYFHLLSKFLMT
jgi:hypothetical protein